MAHNRDSVVYVRMTDVYRTKWEPTAILVY